MEPGRARQIGIDDFLPLERRASATPHAITLLAPAREPLTCREFFQCIQAARAALSEAGVRPGDVTASVLPDGPEVITSFLAIAGLGACAPLDPSLTENEYRFYLEGLGARAIVLHDPYSLAAAAVRTLGLQILQVHPASHGAAGVFHLQAMGTRTMAQPGRSTAAALLLFTSATTGSPKLVPMEWGNLKSISVLDAQASQLTEADRLLSMMPLFHLYGLSAVLAQLFAGGSCDQRARL